jgi:hypothetical protein
VSNRRSDSNVGRGGGDAEVAIDLAGGEAGSAGDRGCALGLLGHLLDLGALGKMHGVFRVLTVGFREAVRAAAEMRTGRGPPGWPDWSTRENW